MLIFVTLFKPINNVLLSFFPKCCGPVIDYVELLNFEPLGSIYLPIDIMKNEIACWPYISFPFLVSMIDHDISVIS